ncbi:conserved hypothetical protein [Ricinus communis]|uniref:Uncharacterized protein n=1 Tax=Ricinus communis TaxID=3988 RepID=B9SMN2_RICCO|nr:conserved hypothetical protein [Ricinus communis]
MAKKNVTESNCTAISKKKSCICSPTSHTGSFRCHLHRATTTQKSPQPLLDTSNKSNSSLCYFRSLSDGKPHLSSHIPERDLWLQRESKSYGSGGWKITDREDPLKVCGIYHRVSNVCIHGD